VAAGSSGGSIPSENRTRSSEGGPEAVIELGPLSTSASPHLPSSSSILGSFSGRPAGRLLVPTSEHGTDNVV
jgi:hypothetical protein